MYAVHPDQLQGYQWEANRKCRAILTAKTYAADQIQIQLIELWLTPRNKSFNICKNAVTLFDSNAFTIPIKRPVADKICQQQVIKVK
ncbi:hypothetical protein MXB_3425 [Myxobolus squamalis]|nr:hypothetical protein MXB_3425 [Myxobolus squamalis]